MKKQLFEGKTLDEMRRLLEDNCENAEEASYNRPLTEDDIAVAKDDLSENYNEFQRLSDELKLVKEQYKVKMQPLQIAMSDAASAIKKRTEERFGILYSFRDEDENMMGYYDDKGELVSSRRLRPDEKKVKPMFGSKVTLDTSADSKTA